MANSADPDQLASEKPTVVDLNCLQRQGISGFSRTRVNVKFWYCLFSSLLVYYFNFVYKHGWPIEAFIFFF